MQFNRLAIIVILLGSGVAGCGKLNGDLPAPSTPGAQIHEAGWNEKTSPNFHGTVLHDGNYNYTTCVTCHAKSFAGGTSGVGCFSCHASFPHKPGWSDTAANNFHGKFLRLGMGQLSDCAQCHGTGFDGGTSGKSCFTCHASYPHKTEWLDPASTGSHGKYLKAKNWQNAECAGCHGSDFTGGTSGKTCFTCHRLLSALYLCGRIGASGVSAQPRVSACAMQDLPRRRLYRWIGRERLVFFSGMPCGQHRSGKISGSMQHLSRPVPGTCE